MVDESKFFIPHGYEMLVVFNEFVLLFLVDYGEVIELVLGWISPSFLFHASHIAHYGVEPSFDVLRVVPQSSVVEGCVVFEHK